MIKKLNFLSIPSVGNRKRPFSYRSRINPVSFSYQSRIDPVSIPYRSPIVLLSFSLPEAETIRKQYGNNMRSIYAGREDDTWWVDGGSVAETWRKRGGGSHDLCQTFRRSIRASLGTATASKETQIVSP